MTILIYELNYMTQVTQEQWIIVENRSLDQQLLDQQNDNENRRLDQQLLDQQNDNEIRRQVNHQSLLTSKKNAKAYSG